MADEYESDSVRPSAFEAVGAHVSYDPIKSPKHYIQKVPGIECIDVVRHFNFCQGNVIKYVWRCGEKGDPIEDLKKAKQYIEFEIERMTNANSVE
jgi:hypothetical protein